MIKLNDYLYRGDTVLRILHRYSEDLERSAEETGREIDMIHSDFLKQFTSLLENNDFLVSQSQRIRDFYIYMAGAYPYLAFIFKGRIKSLIRAEQKFNGYVVEFIHDYFREFGHYPSAGEIRERLTLFRDLIAYRIVLAVPRCRVAEPEEREREELRHLYEIANALPPFLEQRGFTAIPSGLHNQEVSPLLDPTMRRYYRDYVADVKPSGYRSLHVTSRDNSAGCFAEVQLRTKQMDDFAEIGMANHSGYEKQQEQERARRDLIPEGACPEFDEAFERLRLLQSLELNRLDVNMFAAVDNRLINDGCGLYRGRLILPYEHLSRFQTQSRF